MSVDVEVTLRKLSTSKGSFPPPLYTGTRIPVFKTIGTASDSIPVNFLLGLTVNFVHVWAG